MAHSEWGNVHRECRIIVIHGLILASPKPKRDLNYILATAETKKTTITRIGEMIARKFSTLSHERKERVASASYDKIKPRPPYPPIRLPAHMKWGPDWEMSDEFNSSETSNSASRSRWEINNHRWRGRKPGFFKESNVFIYNNILHLKSMEDEPPKTFPQGYHSFSTSFVRTNKTRLYGYFEIVCRLMDNDISSAFWFANNDRKQWTELDVFKYSASNKKTGGEYQFSRLFSTNYHIHRHPNSEVQEGLQSPKSYDIGFALSLKRVKVGFNWQKDYIEWYLNDILIRREKNKYFHQPLHLQLDSETFPFWFGLPQKGTSGLPNFFRIMYVRTWYHAPT